ncbi:MAG TPA: DUF3142 domain-containing protein [Kofleriaceae bacterium]|jgi:hypothetical protein
MLVAAVAVGAVAVGRSQFSGAAHEISPQRLPQSAYVWQRNWTPAVRDAVAHPTAGLDRLDVLAGEVGEGGAAVKLVAIDSASLLASHLPIVLVVRVNGSRIDKQLTLEPLLVEELELRAAGVNVRGIQIDHDSATAALGDYAAWLASVRPGGDLKFSITALPAWGSEAARLASVVDEITVQVHAVRVPFIFDANDAWHDLAHFAQACHTPLRVALPTYRAVVHGDEVRAEPVQIAAFVRRLETHPIAGVGGIAWFRLPVSGDGETWSPAMFASIVATRSADAPRAQLSLVPSGPDVFDVVATNPGPDDVELPSLHVAGALETADLIGYRELAPGAWEAPNRSLRHDERVVIGWMRGKDLSLVQ